MWINLPKYIYKEKISGDNYIFQELISEKTIECIGKTVIKNRFNGYEIQNINDGSEKILIISKKTTSKVLDEYEKILILKNGTLSEENLKNNKNTYEWYKHPNKLDNLKVNNKYLENIKNSWDNFKIIEEDLEKGIVGLRKPQIGGLYSVLGKYTISDIPMTIVMPTGTGKTEAMLAILLKLKIDKLIVVVPTDALREQISEKFIKLGIFEDLKMIDGNCKRPVVGVLKNKIENIENFISKVNVIVTTMSIISGFTKEQQKKISKKCSHLFIDEAHHTPAKTWNKFKENFGNRNIVQFTATPFRNDGKRINGNIIYNYPLKKAQEEGYFKKIIFKPILEGDENKSDKEIMKEAVKQLKEDIRNGYDHILMARCNKIKNAKEIYDKYYNTEELLKYNPILIHSQLSLLKRKELLNKLKIGESKIVVCVDMLGEGYDLPNLKIAAIHNPHKSLGITMQFIGRFTRTSSLKIGNATVIANIINDNFESDLKDMYSENSDWNLMISKKSNVNIEKQIRFQEFIDGFDNLELDISNIKAPFSSVFYKVDDFIWNDTNIEKFLTKNFIDENIKYSINQDEKTVIIIEQDIGKPNFGNIKELTEIKYKLHLLCYDELNSYFYILSDTNSRKNSILEAFTKKYKLIEGNNVFKSFSGLEMLQLFIVGLKEGNPGNIKYRMHAGVDIKSQLTSRDQINKEKSNIFGFGFEKGQSTSIGASRKGKIWAKLNGDILEWKEWCKNIVDKLENTKAEGGKILDWVMEVEKVSNVPKYTPISIDWNEDIYMNYDRIYFQKTGKGSKEIGIENVEISLLKVKKIENKIKFKIFSDKNFNIEFEGIFEGKGNDKNLIFQKTRGDDVNIIKGNISISIVDYFKSNLPIIRYYNGFFLEGNFLKKPNFDLVGYNVDNILAIDWKGVDIKKESKFKNGKEREDSIQSKIIENLKLKKSYDIIFNDDGSGEIADIIGIIFDKQNLSLILELYHCKYSLEDIPGSRIGDLYEVCGQTQRSVRWSNIEKTLKRIIKRGLDNKNRYEYGDMEKIRIIENMFKSCNKIEKKFYIVQPGLSKSKISEEQKKLLEVTENFLMTTFGIKLKILASK